MKCDMMMSCDKRRKKRHPNEKQTILNEQLRINSRDERQTIMAKKKRKKEKRKENHHQVKRKFFF